MPDADHKVTEVHTVESREVLGTRALPLDATLAVDSAGIVADIDVRGQAPVRLVSPGGRVSQFPRVRVVATVDGRPGVGWVEWNRNPATG